MEPLNENECFALLLFRSNPFGGVFRGQAGFHAYVTPKKKKHMAQTPINSLAKPAKPVPYAAAMPRMVKTISQTYLSLLQAGGKSVS